MLSFWGEQWWAEIQNHDLQKFYHAKYIVSYFKQIMGMVSSDEFSPMQMCVTFDSRFWYNS